MKLRVAALWTALLIGTGTRAADTLPDTPAHQMSSIMQMDDQARFSRVLVDELEFRNGDGVRDGVWDAQAQYGNDDDKLLARSEGDWASAAASEGRIDLLWDRIVARWWSLQAGGRYDFGAGPGRGWAALGVAGLAPYWIDIEATVYVGDAGALAGRFKAETDLLMTQRLVLQPELEFNAYSRSDVRRAQGAGVSDFQTGLRLRYAIRREIAPYTGVAWRRSLGSTAQQVRDAGRVPNALQWVAGVRLLF